MAVRSLALLQLVKRTPFRRRHAFKVWRKRLEEKELLNLGAAQRRHQKQAYLGCLPQNLHVLAFLGVHILAKQFEQLGQTDGTARARQA